MAFKMPKLSLKSQNDTCSDISKFDWQDTTIVEEIASGTFGNVYLATYLATNKQVVVKRLRDQNRRESQRAFLKEARLLQNLEANNNIADFIGLSISPYAIMMEYVFFNFSPFGIDKKVSSLRELLDFLHEQDQVSTFSKFQLCIAKDIGNGLSFLHSNNVVHRDLKPDNILVTNQRYTQLTDEEQRLEFSNRPVTAKLADFGESRASYAQTQTLIKSKTSRIDRGTLVFMPPEIHLATYTESNLEDMKKADIWSYGMTLYCLMNPGVDHPYAYDCSKTDQLLTQNALLNFMKEKKLPESDPTYEYVRIVDWWQIEEACAATLKFERECRPLAAELESFLAENQPEESFRIFPPSVSQSSALEESDSKIAQEISSTLDNPPIDRTNTPDNDGTNACTFIGLAICDKFIALENMLDWEEMKAISEDIISNLPSIVNNLRNIDEMYEPICANRILQNENLVAELELSEEFVEDRRIFSLAGREELINLLVKKTKEGSKAIGLYTCAPYTIVIGIHREALFVLDTHPISEALGGNGNGLLLVTEDTSTKSCKKLTQWILKRMQQYGTPNGQQSLAWVTRATSRRHATLEDAVQEITGVASDDDIIGGAETVNNATGERDNIPQDNNSNECQRSIEIVASDSIREELSDEAHDSSSGEELADESFRPTGDPYKDDALTPVFAWNKTAYTGEQLVSILLGTYEAEETCISQPINVSHNVSFLVDTRSFQHTDDFKCDDMGAWKHNGSPKCSFRVVKDSKGNKEIVSLGRKYDASTHQPRTNDYELRRVYYQNTSDPAVRKIVCKLYDNSAQQLPYVLVQYLFKGPEHEIKKILPHGNAKLKSSYKRLFPSTREKLKRSITNKEKTAKEALDEVYVSTGDVTMARSSSELPRGPNDIYNARRSARQDNAVNAVGIEVNDHSRNAEDSGSTNNVKLDNVWTLLERAKREEEESKDSVFIRECSIHPALFVFLANDQQLNELVQFCTNPRSFCVLGIDPTFNIFDRNISLTVTTYRNLKLENSKTGKPPVFVGPLLMHQRKDWQTFSKFAHLMKTAKPDLQGILACGTDGEKALIDGFKRNLRFALFLRCFIHFKDNVKRELTDRGISSEAKIHYLTEIFGKQEGTSKYTGLVDSDSAEQFDSRLESLKSEWEERETACGNKTKNQTFFEWFTREKAIDMKDSMLKPVRIEAGLGDPPPEYTNNDPESANFLIKHGLHFSACKPYEFVEKIKNIIETQQRNEERAVFGMGPYRVRKEFSHLTIDNVQRSRLNHAQLSKKLLDFKKAGMNDMQEIVPTQAEPGEEPSAPRISITAEESGIKSIPLPILESLFERASNLLGDPGNVIPKPGAVDGSFIVAGTCNKIHNVQPGKGGSMSCDRSCTNFSSKICEHVLAVAQVKGVLKEFLAWFKGRRKRVTMMDMVEESGPKTAGKKPSSRKRSNAKRKPIEQYVDLFDQNERHSALPQPTTDTSNLQQGYVPVQLPMASSPSIPEMRPSSSFTSMPCPIGSQRGPHWTGRLPPEMASCSFPSMARFPSIPPASRTEDSPHIPPANQYVSAPFQMSPAFESPTNPYANQGSSLSNQGNGLPASTFQLKWVQGTTVKKCYGCGGDIQNPPVQRPDDLVVVCRDFRQYRDRMTGQLMRSSTPQNVHFHLRRECILTRYPRFHSGLLMISPAFQALLHQEHRHSLSVNFGWNDERTS